MDWSGDRDRPGEDLGGSLAILCCFSASNLEKQLLWIFPRDFRRKVAMKTMKSEELRANQPRSPTLSLPPFLRIHPGQRWNGKSVSSLTFLIPKRPPSCTARFVRGG